MDNNVYMFIESNPTGQWIDITATEERTDELSVRNVRHSIIKNKTKSLSEIQISCTSYREFEYKRYRSTATKEAVV